MSITRDANNAYIKVTVKKRKHLVKGLRDYRTLTQYLQRHPLNPVDLLAMISMEQATHNRHSLLIKLHMRLCAVRRDSEREELLDG